MIELATERFTDHAHAILQFGLVCVAISVMFLLVYKLVTYTDRAENTRPRREPTIRDDGDLPL